MLYGIETLSEKEEAALINYEGIGSNPSKSVYQIITDMIVQKVETEKELPWRMPWRTVAYNLPQQNFVSKKPYRGINRFLLNFFCPFSNPYFLTFNQIKQLKGELKKKAKSFIITYYTDSWFDTEAKKFVSDKKKKELQAKYPQRTFIIIPVLKYYRVFNGEEITGIDFKLPVPEAKTDLEQIESCEEIVKNMPKRPKIRTGGYEAFYRQNSDLVQIPALKYFHKEQEYYSTLFHELIHSTKHSSRLGMNEIRKTGNVFGSKDYSMEELVAEMGAAFLCGESGILYSTLNNTAAYIQHWKKALLKHLKEDKKFVFMASSEAQKAADYILNTPQKQPSSATTKPKKQDMPKVIENPKPKKVILTPTTKPSKIFSSKLVERVDDEITLIKRYLRCHNKNKTKAQLLNILKAVQKAILERRVNKKSMYGTEIMQIQDSLIGIIQERETSFDVTIDSKRLERYMEIAESVAPMVSISLLKRYVNLQEQPGVKEKAKRLKHDIERAFELQKITSSDKYYSQVCHALRNIERSPNSPYISSTQLTGIKELWEGTKGKKGLGFIPTIVAAAAGGMVQAITNKALNGTDDGVMSIEQAKNAKFEEIGFTGEFLKLIGRACKPLSLFLYGYGGSGKSGLALKLSEAFNKLGNKVLYIAGEQYGTPTFTELLKATDISGNENFKIVRELGRLDLADFDLIVIDSKESLGLYKSKDFENLRASYPDKNFIITSQATKSGDYSGDGKWYNVMDTFVFCENGKASTIGEKNRWGGKAEIQLF